MEGNDLNFLSASSAPHLATPHLLPLSTTFPSATPKYSLIDASDPSKEELQSPITNNGRKSIKIFQIIHGCKFNVDGFLPVMEALNESQTKMRSYKLLNKKRLQTLQNVL